MPVIIAFAAIALVQIGLLISAVLPAPTPDEDLGGAPGVFFPTGTGPQYAIGGMDDGCAEWSSDVLTSSGSACGGSTDGFATTSIDTESDLESILTDVSDVYTDNDGTLYASSSVAYYVANALQLGQLSDVNTTSLAAYDVLYWTGVQWARTATSSWDTDTNTTYSAGGTLLDLTGTTFSLNEGTLTDGKICTYESGTGIECDYTDLTGSGDGLATSTEIVDTYVIYGTGASTVGAESAFVYDDALDRLTVVNASTTYVTATRFYGALTGTASLASALAANGGNCSAGHAPLGVDTSGAVESCFDVWTEAENTSAAYISGISGESLTDLSDVDAGQATNDLLVWDGDSWNNYATTSSNLGLVPWSALHDAVTVTGQDFLSLSGQQITGNAINPDNLASADFGDFTCNGASCSLDATYLTGNQTITLSGDVTGSGATSITTAIAAGSIIETDLSGDVDPVDGDYLQYDSTGTNFTWRSASELVADIESAMESALDTLTSLVTVTISTVLQIPNGANPTVDADGEIAHDTTDDQLIVGADADVIRTQERIFGFTLASTSVEFVSGGQIPVPLEKDGYTVTNIKCYVQSGTSVQLTLTDGTNAMDTLTCATTATTDDSSIANATVTADELMYVNVGTISGTPDYVTFAVFGNWTRE